MYSACNHAFPGHRGSVDYLIAKGANINARTIVRRGPRTHSPRSPPLPLPLPPPPLPLKHRLLLTACVRAPPPRLAAVHVDGATLGGDQRAH